jgi:glycosyltransferase involved in cell wall biosynthesis
VSLSVVLLTSAPAWRGSGASLAKIARGLARAGHRAVVLSGSEEVCARLADEGVTATKVPLQRTGWREVRALSASLRRLAADLVLVDTPRDVRLAALATAWRPIPIVFRYNLSRRVLESHPGSRLLFLRVGAIAYQSEYARDRALRTSPWLAGRRGEVIRNGYDRALQVSDPAVIAKFRAAHGLGANRATILSGAALFLDKGHMLAIDAMARVTATRPVDFVVCGTGDDAALIRAAADRAGLTVRFVGQLAGPDWHAALASADIVLHPSTGELFGNVVAEAMLQARAVVAVDSGATPEVMGRDGAAGVLVPPDDAVALASAVTALLDDPARRAAMGEAARARILSGFSIDVMENGYVRLIEGLTGAPRSTPAHSSARQAV